MMSIQTGLDSRKRQTSGVQSVERALQILSCFTVEEKLLSVGEISAKLVLPKSTVVRLLHTLKSHRFIEQDAGTQRYRLGFKVLELGNAYASNLDLRQVALPIMKALNEETLETVSLNVVDRYNRICIEKVESNQQIRNFVKVGARSPLCYGASGKVLLSHLTKEEQEMVMQQEGLDQLQQQKLAAHIRQIVKDGYAVSDSERIEGLLSISAPIFDGSHQVIAGLSLSGPIARTYSKRQQMICLLKAATAAISREMGCAMSFLPPDDHFHQ